MAFIAMSGLSYINFMPGLVNALAGGIGFGELGAGQIVALNGFGGLLGCAIAIAVVGRVEWRRALFVFLLSALSMLKPLWAYERPKVSIVSSPGKA